MASINGIALKAVKSFQTMDGVGFTSNVYIGNKKIGTAGDGGYGGEVELYIDREHREDYSKRVKEYYEKNPAEFNGETWFINELYELWETEKTFKSNSKKGFPILIAMSYHKRNAGIDEIFDGGGYKPDSMVGVQTEKSVKEQIVKNKPVEYKIYRAAADFSL